MQPDLSRRPRAERGFEDLTRVDLGELPYGVAAETMRGWVAECQAGTAGDRLFLLSHPAVVTYGVRTRPEHLPAAASGLPTVQVDRGGQATVPRPGAAGGLPGRAHPGPRPGRRGPLDGERPRRGARRARLRGAAPAERSRRPEPGRGLDPGPPQDRLDRDAYPARREQPRLLAQRRPRHERVRQLRLLRPVRADDVAGAPRGRAGPAHPGRRRRPRRRRHRAQRTRPDRSGAGRG